MKFGSLSLGLWLAAQLSGYATGQVVYGDRFNYHSTIVRADGFSDYEPSQWDRIDCDESTREGLEACIGYPDKWEEGESWRITDNHCLWCPADQEGSCGTHHSSPIGLLRDRGLGYWGKTEENNGDPGAGANANAKECIDVHWMKYEDSWCPFDQMVDSNSFTVDRHALRINQPISVDENDVVDINCSVEGLGKRFGRIDFSKGFSQWWFLSHIDIHLPSEHVQENQQYDGELQMHHFYSVSANTAGVDNELGTVAIFLQAFDDVPPNRDFDRVICQWRRHENEVRTACGLDPIEGSYPGCYSLHESRTLRKTAQTDPLPSKDKRFQNVQDLLLAHDIRQNQLDKGLDVPDDLPKLQMGPENWGPDDKTEEEWAEFIAEKSAEFKADEELWKELHQEFHGDTAKAHEEFHERRRKLIEGNELIWFNYWPMLNVRTEYYFRYSGSQTIPPCYGRFDPDSRRGTNHWRVMKDPIRIHPRQLDEMRRLLRERIAPVDDAVMACQPDTAAKVDGEKVDTARPVQYLDEVHYMVFCECKDWPSKWPEDREWCSIEDYNERFYTTPYNFPTEGF